MEIVLLKIKPISFCLLLSTSTFTMALPPEVNDPLFQQTGTDLDHQWGLHALNLHQAWEYSKGHAYIAVLDTGIEVGHPDLQENFRPHFSWDFYNSRYDVDELTPYINNEGIMDWVGHGTHVAGILAASTNNGIGGAGICWHCSLMVGKISKISSHNTYGNGASVDHQLLPFAITTAVNAGAQVINMSLGSGEENYDNLQDIRDALAYADQMDVMVVAANGNNENNDAAINFPASESSVIAAGAIDIDGNAPDWSKFGPEQDLAGPGFHVLSTFYTGHDYMPDNYPRRSVYECAESITPNSPGYGPCSGTSMAAPHIAGSAALLRSVNPLLTSDEVKDLLVRHASLAGNPQEGLGHGLPDVLASVKSALGTVNGQTLVNRLTPLFNLYSRAAQDSLSTTSPQMAMAAMFGRLQPQPWSGGDVIWHAGEGNTVPGYTSFPRVALSRAEQPMASVYIFTTHRNPANPDGAELTPLYRLSYRGTDNVANESNIDHTYATDLAEVEFFTRQGYELDGIEGYIYPSNESQPSDTVRLLRKYNPQRDDHAIFPETMLDTMTAQGYTHNSGDEWIGYVYLNQDSDRDGLIDGFEHIIGTDVNLRDSDDDGQTDGAEIARYPYSDPYDGLAANTFTHSAEVDAQWSTLGFSEDLDNTPVLLSQMQTFNGGDPAATRIRNLTHEGLEIFIEEERSSDNEVHHLVETVGMLGLPEGDILNNDGEIIGEAGFVSSNGGDWKVLNFSRSYSNPIVLMEMVTYNGPQPAHIRLNNVTSTNTRYKIEEWGYLDGAHATETISYLVVEQGAQVLQSGQAIRTGVVEADHGWSDIAFEEMGSRPVVFSQSQTYNGAQPVVTRQRGVQTDGFRVRLQEEQGSDGSHANETIGYLAIE
jgi:hypothetical protein